MTPWPSIVFDLLGTGLSRPELAAAVGAGVATINDLARGDTREPRHALGEKLLALHAERCTKNSPRKRGSTRGGKGK